MRMGSVLIDERDVKFVLHEQLEIMSLTSRPLFENFSREEFDMVLDQAGKFAEKELMPANSEGDRTCAKWDNGAVTLPKGYYTPLRMFGEHGWVSACDEPEIGGQGLPVAIFTACNELFHAANTALNLYPSLAHGTATMIRHHGTESQKRKYLEKLLTYKWAGSMNLTEPGAGSSLAQIQTKAVRMEDGRYKISGQKIFITGGEHDAHPNIIHPVLARIEGDPPGIKGISIFLVPKYHVHEDGSIGERNDVNCAGIEHKMGFAVRPPAR
ncbi:MAG: acyl-CoA dehydrogenase [Spirochaetales bacterium]|nr:MAG: acyl-CoA dehydrogenase [Spirochaetales bacterium]